MEWPDDVPHPLVVRWTHRPVVGRFRGFAVVVGAASFVLAVALLLGAITAAAVAWLLPSAVAVTALLVWSWLPGDVAVHRFTRERIEVDEATGLRCFPATDLLKIRRAAVAVGRNGRPSAARGDDLGGGVLLEVAELVFLDQATVHVPSASPEAADTLAEVLRRCYLDHPSDDPWTRRPAEVHHRPFAHGSRRSFDWYLDGSTSVMVASLDEVDRWLRGCQYARDASGDHWRHPREFELMRFGDCEDHALWAWRKLLELGFDAEFVVGRVQPHGLHAWVHVRIDGEWMLFETTHKGPRPRRPLAAPPPGYRPLVSVDGRLQTYAFGR